MFTKEKLYKILNQTIQKNEKELWRFQKKKLYRMVVNSNEKFSVYIHVPLNRANKYSYMEFPFETAT